MRLWENHAGNIFILTRYRKCRTAYRASFADFHTSFAQSIHDRSIQLDKAAVLNYCQIKNRDGRWVGCECVFTIVYDVLVASTSVYRRGPSSQSTRLISWTRIRNWLTKAQNEPSKHQSSATSFHHHREIPDIICFPTYHTNSAKKHQPIPTSLELRSF